MSDQATWREMSEEAPWRAAQAVAEPAALCGACGSDELIVERRCGSIGPEVPGDAFGQFAVCQACGYESRVSQPALA